MFALHEVTSGYGKVPVLKNVSIEVASGEVVCIVGANGAGKTTLMRTVSGIIPLRSGKKLLDGKDITELPPAKLTRLGLVQIPEGRLIIKELSVKDNLLIGAYCHYFKISRDELNRDLGRVYELFPRLEQRLKQKAGTLSGGEQQMLAIGRGLMARPRLLMLDEPSLGLAPMLVQEMFRTVKELNRQGLPILLIEQNVRASLKIADRCYIMETGSIVLEGNARDMMEDEQVKRAYLGA